MHGILTADHLFDGTITTAIEQYYVEPASRYATDASSSSGSSIASNTQTHHRLGVDVHSVVYKVSDVRHPSNMPSPLLPSPQSRSAATLAETTTKKQQQQSPPKTPPQTKDDDDDDSGVDDLDDADGQSEDANGNDVDVAAARTKDSYASGRDGTFCASERLRRKMQMDFKRRRRPNMLPNDSDSEMGIDGDENANDDEVDQYSHRRTRRWLPEEVTITVY